MNLVLFRAYCTFVTDLRFVQSRRYSNLHGLNNKICDEMKYPVKKILLTQLDHHSKKNEILQRSVESNIRSNISLQKFATTFKPKLLIWQNCTSY